MKLTERHLKLYKAIVERDEGNICNDLNPDELSMLGEQEWKAFCIEYYKWNGDYEETLVEGFNYVMLDFMVVSFITHLLIEHYVSTKSDQIHSAGYVLYHVKFEDGSEIHHVMEKYLVPCTPMAEALR